MDSQEAIDVNLPIVSSAIYGSADDQHLPLCQEGTRVGILRDITEWASSETAESVLWVHGPAGTGKSTIIRSIARSFSENGFLAASYFFRRGEKERNGVNKVFSTLAHGLALSIPGFKKALRQSLDKYGYKESEIVTRGLEEQFKVLILTPMSTLQLPEGDSQSSPRLTCVIVVDALDECDDDDGISQLYEEVLKVQAIQSARIRIIFTSRYEAPIADAVVQEGQLSCRELSLQSAYLEETRNDIAEYLRKNFAEIKAKRRVTKNPWPKVEDMERIVDLATTPSPLFIYAATLCRFVYDKRTRAAKNPVKQLDLWLQQCDANHSQLSQVYIPILKQLLDGRDGLENEDKEPLPEDERELLVRIIATVAFITEPLNSCALAALLRVEEYDVQVWLRNLHAVLQNDPEDPNAPVRFLHKSFVDFMTQSDDAVLMKIRVDELHTHRELASACIARITGEYGLRRDICHLGDLTIKMSKVPEDVVQQHIPSDLRYACLHWFDHLQQVSVQVKGAMPNANIYYDFFQDHLLHWVEAVILLRELPTAVTIMSSFRACFSWLQAHEHDSQPLQKLFLLLDDALRFVLKRREEISSYPLQLYTAALVFSPKDSLVRQNFLKAEDEAFGIRGTDYSWGLAKQSFRIDSLRTYAQNTMSLSPDGILLAAAERNWVTVWDFHSGKVLHRMESDHGAYLSGFTPDNKFLVSVLGNGALTFQDPHTGAIKQRIEPQDYKPSDQGWEPSLLRFTEDGHPLVLFEVDNQDFHFMDPTRRATVYRFPKAFRVSHRDGPAISADSSLAAYVDDLTTVCIQSLDGHIEPLRLERHEHPVDHLEFSPDGRLLASASTDNVVMLWNVKTWSFVRKVQLNKPHSWTRLTKKSGEEVIAPASYMRSMSFSADSALLALSSSPDVVYIWDLGNVVKTVDLGDQTGWISETLIPAGGAILLARDEDIIRCWDIASVDGTKPEDIAPVMPGQKHVTKGRFSPNGLEFAAVSNNGTIRLWSSVTGRVLRILVGHPPQLLDLCFSADGQHLLSSGADGFVRLHQTSSGEMLREWKGGWCEKVALSPSGRIAAFCKPWVFCSNNYPYGWTFEHFDTKTGAQICAVQSTIRDFGEVSFSADDQWFAFRSKNGEQNLFNIPTGSFQRSQDDSSDKSILGLSISPDGTLLASCSTSALIHIWDLPEASSPTVLRGHGGPVRCISFSRDGQMLASGSEDHSIIVWDPVKQAKLRAFQGHTSGICLVSFSPCGKFLASISEDGTFRYWDILTETAVHDVHLGTSEGYDMADRLPVVWPSETCVLAACASEDKIRLWRSDRGSDIEEWVPKQKSLNRAVLSPDGQFIAFPEGTSLAILDTTKKQVTWSLKVKAIGALSFSPDGQRIALWTTESIQLFDVATGEKLQSTSTKSFKTDRYVAMVFSPDGETLAWGHKSGKLRVWNIATGNVLDPGQDHGAQITDVCFSPDGRMLASASRDGTALLWNLDSNECSIISAPDSRAVVSTAFYPDGLRVGSDGVNEAHGCHDEDFEFESRIDLDRDQWITKDGIPKMILPHDCRTTYHTVRGNLLVAGLKDGKVLFIEDKVPSST